MQKLQHRIGFSKGGLMVYKDKGKFELDFDLLQKIVDKILQQPRNSDVKARIDKSPNSYSKSLYLRLFIGNTTTSLRISDHECKGATRQIIVQESTGIANVCYKIEGAIADLRYKRIQELLGGCNEDTCIR